MEFIATLAGLLLATQLVAHLCRRVEIPEVIGQILVGIIAGPALLNWVHLNSMMNEFQEIGVIILMFIAGLESDLSLLKKYLKPAVVVAIVGVVVPIAIMAPASYFFGFTTLESIFIGVIFSATSVSISVAVLREFKRLDSREGATILGAAVADDIIGVILLSIMISVVLREFKRLDSREGATILGAAVADDIIGVILLSIMISVVNQAEGKTGGQPLWAVLLLQVLFIPN